MSNPERQILVTLQIPEDSLFNLLALILNHAQQAIVTSVAEVIEPDPEITADGLDDLLREMYEPDPEDESEGLEVGEPEVKVFSMAEIDRKPTFKETYVDTWSPPVPTLKPKPPIRRYRRSDTTTTGAIVQILGAPGCKLSRVKLRARYLRFGFSKSGFASALSRLRRAGVVTDVGNSVRLERYPTPEDIEAIRRMARTQQEAPSND